MHNLQLHTLKKSYLPSIETCRSSYFPAGCHFGRSAEISSETGINASEGDTCIRRYDNLRISYGGVTITNVKILSKIKLYNVFSVFYEKYRGES